MRSRYRINDPDLPHFITATVVEWLPIFTTSACCEIVAQSLVHCREKKALRVYAWVVLDNHFHAIVAGPDLAKTMGDMKKFTAGNFSRSYRRKRRDWLLQQLQYFRARHKTASTHQVWQEGVHPQSIRSDAVMLQKLEYLHNNPVKRGLVALPEHWRYSSAHEWLAGALPAVPVRSLAAGVNADTKRSFGDTCVPKRSLGTRGISRKS